MNIKDVLRHENVNFSGLELPHFLLGLLSAFDNRFQAVADKIMKEVSWKQFFAIICINLCREAPSVKELAEIMGSSHQNVKQILLKLEKKGFVTITTDDKDRRKQRVALTEYCREFCVGNEGVTSQIMAQMFQGISEVQLQTTVQTILQMGENLKGVSEQAKGNPGKEPI